MAAPIAKPTFENLKAVISLYDSLVSSGVDECSKGLGKASTADFFKRLHTFNERSWHAGPPELSPVSCASRGWVALEPGVLRCSSCAEVLVLPSRGHRRRSGGSRKVSESLVSKHKQFCRWKALPSDVHLKPPARGGKEVREWLATRCRLMQDLQLPDTDWQSLQQEGLSEADVSCLGQALGSEEAWVLAAALTGWLPRSDLTDTLHCEFCRRSVGLWNHRPSLHTAEAPDDCLEGEGAGACIANDSSEKSRVETREKEDLSTGDHRVNPVGIEETSEQSKRNEKQGSGSDVEASASEDNLKDFATVCASESSSKEQAAADQSVSASTDGTNNVDDKEVGSKLVFGGGLFGASPVEEVLGAPEDAGKTKAQSPFVFGGGLFGASPVKEAWGAPEDAGKTKAQSPFVFGGGMGGKADMPTFGTLARGNKFGEATDSSVKVDDKPQSSSSFVFGGGSSKIEGSKDSGTSGSEKTAKSDEVVASSKFVFGGGLFSQKSTGTEAKTAPEISGTERASDAVDVQSKFVFGGGLGDKEASGQLLFGGGLQTTAKDETARKDESAADTSSSSAAFVFGEGLLRTESDAREDTLQHSETAQVPEKGDTEDTTLSEDLAVSEKSTLEQDSSVTSADDTETRDKRVGKDDVAQVQASAGSEDSCGLMTSQADVGTRKRTGGGNDDASELARKKLRVSLSRPSLFRPLAAHRAWCPWVCAYPVPGRDVTAGATTPFWRVMRDELSETAPLSLDIKTPGWESLLQLHKVVSEWTSPQLKQSDL